MAGSEESGDDDDFAEEEDDETLSLAPNVFELLFMLRALAPPQEDGGETSIEEDCKDEISTGEDGGDEGDGEDGGDEDTVFSARG